MAPRMTAAPAIGSAAVIAASRSGALVIPMSPLRRIPPRTCARACAGAVSALALELARLRTAAELYGGVTALKKALDYTMSNVSPAAVCGWLSWELR